MLPSRMPLVLLVPILLAAGPMSASPAWLSAEASAVDRRGEHPEARPPATAREHGGSYRLKVREGVLVAAHFRTGDRAFQPVEPDRFRSGGFGDVRFLRDDEGRIVEFTANQTRIRGLRFVRVRD